MKYFDLLVYFWKRNNWIFNYLFFHFNKINFPPIKNPIFLVGNQGDGLTLLSRMIRRNDSVVSVTGNSKYWAGADEMQNVLEPILSPEISAVRINAPFHPVLKPPRSWSYACNELIDKYRKTNRDYNERDEKKIKNAIGMIIRKHGKKITNPRFIDKSQVFTVKMSFIDALLKDCNPYFILVTRNPYASCFRAARGKAGDMRRYSKFLSLDKRIKICIEHWYNSMKAVEEDKNKVNNFMSIKFEDLLTTPENTLKKICNFVKLDFSINMIPQKEHVLPFGSKFKERWYPLRPDVNDSYLKQLPEKYGEWIYKKCGKLAEKYGYVRPNK